MQCLVLDFFFPKCFSLCISISIETCKLSTIGIRSPYYADCASKKKSVERMSNLVSAADPFSHPPVLPFKDPTALLPCHVGTFPDFQIRLNRADALKVLIGEKSGSPVRFFSEK